MLRREEGPTARHQQGRGRSGSTLSHQMWTRRGRGEGAKLQSGQPGLHWSTARPWLLPSRRSWLWGQQLASPGQAPPGRPGGDGGFHILFSSAFLLNINLTACRRLCNVEEQETFCLKELPVAASRFPSERRLRPDTREPGTALQSGKHPNLPQSE